MMKILYKTILMSAILAIPFAATQAQAQTQAHESAAAHKAWIEAQKIDIKPTIHITETQIPAGSMTNASGSGTPGMSAPSSAAPTGSSSDSMRMPSNRLPRATTPDTGYPTGNSRSGQTPR